MYSSNSGRWPGSTQPDGLVISATDTDDVPVFTRPTNSLMSFGGSPAAGMVVGSVISAAISPILSPASEACVVVRRIV